MNRRSTNREFVLAVTLSGILSMALPEPVYTQNPWYAVQDEMDRAIVRGDTQAVSALLEQHPDLPQDVLIRLASRAIREKQVGTFETLVRRIPEPRDLDSGVDLSAVWRALAEERDPHMAAIVLHRLTPHNWTRRAAELVLQHEAFSLFYDTDFARTAASHAVRLGHVDIASALGMTDGEIAEHLAYEIGNMTRTARIRDIDYDKLDRLLEVALPKIGRQDAGRILSALLSVHLFERAELVSFGAVEPRLIRWSIEQDKQEILLWLVDHGFQASPDQIALAFSDNSSLLDDLVMTTLSPEDAVRYEAGSPDARALSQLNAGIDPLFFSRERSRLASAPVREFLAAGLHAALVAQNRRLVDVYLEAGADVTLDYPGRGYRKEWQSTMQLAAKMGDLQLLRKLRSVGAPEMPQNGKGKSPSEIVWHRLRSSKDFHIKSGSERTGHRYRLPRIFSEDCNSPATNDWSLECQGSDSLVVRYQISEDPLKLFLLRLQRQLGLPHDQTPPKRISGASEDIPDRWQSTITGQRLQVTLTVQVEGPPLNAPDIDHLAELAFANYKVPASRPLLSTTTLTGIWIVLMATASILIFVLAKRRQSNAAKVPWDP